ncbi:DUF5641 domain-containing protein [Trichonephila clavipes]|nr:DUF5641 domain-containing protein [Trichonephila clavipes]
MNPADIACRGLSPKELPTCVLWWEGPSMAFLYRATTSKQLMGDLPTHRVTPSRPFSVCGVEYAGPINILRYRGEVITSSPEHTNDDKLSLFAPLGYCPKNEVGEIVIIKEDNIPPATWPLGKVIETHPGKDGVVRVVTLRTVKGRFKRPIHKLCKLPLHQE